MVFRMDEDKSLDTLLPIVRQHVREESIFILSVFVLNIISLYANLLNTLNHSINFIEPGTEACINHIESIWQKLRSK
ncbi:hypothetical protein H311_00225 [Anncaliia algerae PRA109]|nr:hypothetical protein H311_00225 [Anncaliia algerae PRA109]